jgi:large subunit ribosomal protein L30
MAWIVVRVRGGIHARREIVETLAQLHLTRPNHATVVPEEPAFVGMVYAVQGYVTWGEADPATVTLLLEQRGFTRDGKRLGASANGGGGTSPAASMAEEVVRVGLSRVRALKPLVRLKAPKGGWKSTKRPFATGGALGYRGVAINELVRRMM